MIELQTFRKDKDSFFVHHAQSPLTHDQKRAFRGLHYFPENKSLRFEVQVNRFDVHDEIQVPTSTGDRQTYERYGRCKFQVNGRDAELTIYKTPHGFFLPFVDSLAGKKRPIPPAAIWRSNRWATIVFSWISTWPTTRTVHTTITGHAH
jgi:uncharacterized protein (DUF1684 family)